MEFQTSEARQFAGLKPVDGVFKLEAALERINMSILEVPESSVAFDELQSLKQTYSSYRDEAKELRQKGMASFRKYLAAKNGDTPNASPAHSNLSKISKISNQSNGLSAGNLNGSHSTSGTANATQINININNPQNTQIPPQSVESPQRSGNPSNEVQKLSKQNESLISELTDLRSKLSEFEETEHELRLILEEYKFSQLSHKQEISALKNTVNSYKKASSQKGQSLDTLSNELETNKVRNQAMAKLNAQLKHQVAEYLKENTNLKQQLIESNGDCEALRRENGELRSKLKLSQQLNPMKESDGAGVDMDSIDAPVQPVEVQKTKLDVPVQTTDIEHRLRRVYDELTRSQNPQHTALCVELETILEQLHPINTISTIPTPQSQQPSEPAHSVDGHGNYVLTASEYADIERVVEDRDTYLNEARFLQQERDSMMRGLEELRVRCSQLEEEKSLMMRTLKLSVEKLATENTELKEKVGSVDERVSSIKEHDQTTLNKFHQIYEENKERKFEMETMERRIEELVRDVATFRYLSENLQNNNAKLRTDLADALERIDKVVEDKEIIARKLRESNKLTHEILRERQGTKGVKTVEEKDGQTDNLENIESRYERVLAEKMELEKQFDESDGTVNELTNQVIELETRLRELELENEMLRKEVAQISAENAKQSSQIKSAQRVALSIMQSNKENGGTLGNGMSSRQTDIFGLQPPPEPDLITSLLTYLLPFLFEEDDQPKIV